MKALSAKSLFYVAVIIILLVMTYYVYQTYLWFSRFVGLASGDVPDDTSDMQDMIEQLNAFFQQILQYFRGGK